MEISNQKTIIRKQMRSKRTQVRPQEYAYAEAQIVQQLKPILELTNNIAIYYSTGKELSLSLLLNYCLESHKSLYAPIATRHSRIMRFEQVFDTTPRQIFYPEDYHIHCPIDIRAIDLILIPLLACDLSGIRLGQGGGYYDSTLAKVNKNTILCGIGYDWQLVDNLPAEEWDLRLDYFASESRLIHFD